MKKLSFSISNSSSKPNPIAKKPSTTFDDGAQKISGDAVTAITEFGPGDSLSGDGKAVAVIPPLQNEFDWRRSKKMKNLHLPSTAAEADDSGGIKFELESGKTTDDSKITYGLNLRDRSDGGDEPQPSTEDTMLERLRFDLKRLPEDRGFAEFDDVPVEGFGAAILKGYGWYEGRGIGKKAVEDVKVVEYTRRTDKQGLGFVSDDPPPSKVDAGALRKDNSGSKVKEKDELLGKTVRIIGGREAGMRGTVLERLGNRKLAVRLAKSEETVNVHIEDIANIGSREEERCLRRLKEVKAAKKSPEKTRRKKEADWVASSIRVRVVSKELRGGGLYLKKGEVVDVAGPGVCDVSMDESREVIQGLRQDSLETVVPRRGGTVLVLTGKHRGVCGSLVERDSERETGVVRDANSHEMVEVRFEQMAEYVGDPSDLGY